jgi:formate transporter FocA
MSESGDAAPDALLPPAMAERVEQVGVRKAEMDLFRLFALAFLAGAFIALGAVFSTTVGTGGAELPYGQNRLLMGTAFSLGLILVIVGGAELFTGNMLIVMAWANRKVPTTKLLRNWSVAYVGNFAGSVATAGVVFASGQYRFAGGDVGLLALRIADAKVSLGFIEAVALGAMCNVLVCLAVWLTFSARTTTDRVLVIVPPITAFVACGFEHCVANMYFVPFAIFVRAFAPDVFWGAAGATPDAFANIQWAAFLQNNLLPVTVGTMIGGALMVAAVYWSIYLRKS